jgi:hypothetical protein
MLSRRLAPGLAFVALLGILIGCGGGGGGGVGTLTSGNNGGNNNGSNNNNGGNNNGGNNNGGNNGLPAGQLPANVIFYTEVVPAGESELNVQVRHMSGEGANDTLYTTLSGSSDETRPQVVAFAPSPVEANVRFFAYQANLSAPIGIYRNTSVNIQGATQVVAPTYSVVSQLMVSPDGSTLAYVAATGEGQRRLYRVAASGASAPVLLDAAEQAAVSPTGDRVVYSRPTPGSSDAGDIWSRPLKSAGDAVQLTNSPADDTYPTFSRDGSRVVFSSGATFFESDLFTMKSDGTDVVRVTNTPDVVEAGATFNEAGSQIAYIATDNSDSTNSGVYRIAASGDATTRVLLRASTSLGADLYWTSADGRSRRIEVMRLTLPRKKQAAKAEKAPAPAPKVK